MIAIESSEHVADKPRFFAEAQRVLRPGGRLVVCAWLASDAPRRWQIAHLLEPICREGRLGGLGTAEEHRGWIEGAGLIIDEHRDLSRNVKRTWPVCAWRTLRALARQPEHRRWLLRGRSDNRVFGLTVLRIWLAYELGAMRYGVFKARRPESYES